jgi:hypothetical protein
MLTTTLNRIRAEGPCRDGWEKLLSHLGKHKADDVPIGFDVILSSNGLDDALWCLRAEPQHANAYRQFAVKCARRLQHLMTDQRSLDALDVAERHARGQATDDELVAAMAAAWAAARAAACTAACAAAWSAACAAARDAARNAARNAARDAGWDAACAAARDAQTADFVAMINSVEG